MKTDLRPLFVIFILACMGYAWAGGSFIPSSSPIPINGLHVLIIEETGDRGNLPKEQLDILTGTSLSAYVKIHNGKFRQLDLPVLEEEEQVWKDAAELERDSLPWLIISNHPKGGVSIPFPEDTGKIMTILEKYGGE